MTDIISFTPVLVYLLFALTSVLIAPRFVFNAHLGVFLISALMHVSIAFFLTNSVLEAVLGLSTGVILYVLMVFFLGGKASGETFFVTAAAIALAPFPHGTLFAGLGLILMAGAAVISMRRQLDMVQFLVIEQMSNSGLGARKPDFSSLPNRKDLTKADKKVHVAPFMMVAMVIGTVWMVLI